MIVTVGSMVAENITVCRHGAGVIIGSYTLLC